MSAGTVGRATTALAEHVAGPWGCAPDPALDLAATAVLDVVAVALAAANEPAVAHLLAGVDAAPGSCTILVDGQRADPVRAALVNGTAAHALDYDDVDDLTIGHPSAVLVPAALAVGERVDATGAQFAEAYWRGFTIMRALASGLGIGAHYARGWHSTATLGVVGAAGTAAALLGLDAERARHALGIAASRAAGSRQNFGSETKPLHAGAAAADGVLAASLAGAGLTANGEQFDGRYGFLALYTGGGPLSTEALNAAADRLIATLNQPGPPVVNVKLLPCCYATIAAADAALDLIASGISTADVDTVTVAVPSGGLRPLIDGLPKSGLEGKFSMPYVVAACLLDKRVHLASFTDAAVSRPEILDLASRVTAEETLIVDQPNEGLVFAAEVTIRTRSGKTAVARCDTPRGHALRPASPADLEVKFADCARFAGINDPAALSAVAGIKSVGSIGAVLATLRRVVVDARG